MKRPGSRTFLLVALCLAFSESYLSAQQTVAERGSLLDPHYQIRLSALAGPPAGYRRWQNGYFLSFALDGTLDASPDKPAVVLYDRTGKVARQAIAWFKDAATTGVDDAAVSSSGDLFVSGGTTSPAGAIANYIAQIDHTGHVGRVIRTTPFLPIYICAAEDGTVWSYGFDKDQAGSKVANSLALRQYSFDKGQLRAMLDTSTLKSSGWALSRGHYPGEIELGCTSEKVGLLNGASSEWVEFDIPSNKLKISKIEPMPPADQMRITGFALTDSGEVFVSLHDRSSRPPRSGLFRLGFSGADVGQWVAVKGTVGPFQQGAKVGQLLGAEGTELIYTRDYEGTAYWSRITK